MNSKPDQVLSKQLLVLVALVLVAAPLTQSCCSNGGGGVGQDEREVVHLVVMMPYPDPLGRDSFTASYDDGHDITPAAFLAAEQINNRTDILDGYKLELIRSDGGCTIIGRTVYGFARDVAHRMVPIAGIVGPSCDSSSEIISGLTSNERAPLVTLNYGGVGVFLNYPNSFGILGPDATFGDAFFKLMLQNEWKRVAFLHILTDEGPEVLSRLRKRINEVSGYEIAFTAPLYESYIPIDLVRESFVRVIFLASTPEISRRLLCLAYHQGMVFPNYQWIFETHLDIDFYETRFSYNGEMYECSRREVYTALNGSLNFFNRFDPETESTVTFSGLTYPQYLDDYNNQIQIYKDTFNVSSMETYWANPVFDATWAFALALNSSLEELEHSNLTFREEGLGRQREITEIIQRHMFDVDFLGITGQIKFDRETRFLIQILDLLQYDGNGTSKKIGAYKSGELVMLPSANSTFIEHNFQVSNIRLNAGIAVIFLVLAVLALSLAIPAQVINVIYRKHKSIKASSPKLNHIVFSGCYLVIFGLVLYTFSETLSLSLNTHTVLCNLFPCSCIIGLALILATVCVKTWRLYYIFTANGKPNKRILIKDRTLAGIVGVLTLIQFAITIPWMIAAPLKANAGTYLDDFDGAVPRLVTEVKCRSEGTLGSVIALAIYNGLLLSLALVFAFLSRKIHLKEFETKNVIVFVYLLSILSALGIPVNLIVFITSDVLIVQFVVLSICLLVAVYICLGVLFLPPIIPIIREKIRKDHPAPKQEPTSYRNRVFEWPAPTNRTTEYTSAD